MRRSLQYAELAPLQLDTEVESTARSRRLPNKSVEYAHDILLLRSEPTVQLTSSNC